MKKIAFFLAILLLFMLPSCGTNKQADSSKQDTTDKAEETTGDYLSEDTTVTTDTTIDSIDTEIEDEEDTTSIVTTATESETTKKQDTDNSKNEIVSGGNIITQNPQTSTATPIPPHTPETNKEYESITCIEATTKKTLYLGSSRVNESVSVTVPGDWTLSGSLENGYKVLRSGKEIGTALKSSSISHTLCENCTQYNRFGVKLDHCIQKGSSSYVQRLAFTNKSGEIIVFSVEYKYVSAATLQTMRNTMRSDNLHTDPGLGSLSLSKGNGNNSILILGNSFIQTSKVGEYLEEMIINGGKDCKVTAVSRGYYTLSSYVEDAGTMNRIKAGEYGAVFICGIYGINEVYDLKYMKEACQQSNTLLIVFPAHNESEEFINEAKKQYYNVSFLNWKNEIDTFIDKGVPWSNFCRDDEHKHSKPLAGYVGAHMIYRSVFGEIPPLVNSNDQAYFSSQLGSYINTGGIPCTVNGEVYYF